MIYGVPDIVVVFSQPECIFVHTSHVCVVFCLAVEVSVQITVAISWARSPPPRRYYVAYTALLATRPYAHICRAVHVVNLCRAPRNARDRWELRRADTSLYSRDAGALRGLLVKVADRLKETANFPIFRVYGCIYCIFDCVYERRTAICWAAMTCIKCARNSAISLTVSMKSATLEF